MVEKTEKRGRKPKPKVFSDKVKAAYLKAAKKLTKEYGMTPEEVVLRMVYDETKMQTARVGAAKLYNEALLVKETDITTHKDQGPAVYLPERKPDPAKVVQIKREGTNN